VRVGVPLAATTKFYLPISLHEFLTIYNKVAKLDRWSGQWKDPQKR